MPLPFLLATILAGATPATDMLINTHDTRVFEQQLREMGYKIDPFTLEGDIASSVIHSGDDKLAIVLGGCTKGDACDYVVLVGAFTDVIKPPADWIARMNSAYDLIKVSNRESDGALSYSAGAVLDGVPRTTFRHWIEKVETSSNDLAAEAVKAKFIQK